MSSAGKPSTNIRKHQSAAAAATPKPRRARRVGPTLVTKISNLDRPQPLRFVAAVDVSVLNAPISRFLRYLLLLQQNRVPQSKHPSVCSVCCGLGASAQLRPHFRESLLLERSRQVLIETRSIERWSHWAFKAIHKTIAARGDDDDAVFCNEDGRSIHERRAVVLASMLYRTLQPPTAAAAHQPSEARRAKRHRSASLVRRVHAIHEITQQAQATVESVSTETEDDSTKRQRLVHANPVPTQPTVPAVRSGKDEREGE
jgi:hypothetical protein